VGKDILVLSVKAISDVSYSDVLNTPQTGQTMPLLNLASNVFRLGISFLEKHQYTWFWKRSFKAVGGQATSVLQGNMPNENVDEVPRIPSYA